MRTYKGRDKKRVKDQDKKGQEPTRSAELLGASGEYNFCLVYPLFKRILCDIVP